MQTPPSPLNCFVAVFDILGFKAFRAREGTDGLYRLFSKGIAPAIAHSAAGRGKHIKGADGVGLYVPDPSPISCKFISVSDTVFFFSANDSFESFLGIIQSSCQLLQFGMNGFKAPFRGAIGHGDLIHDTTDVFIGSAIEDAYAGEQSQVWAGCMLTEKARKFVTDNNYIESYKALFVAESSKIEDQKERERVLRAGKRLVNYSQIPLQKNPKDGPVQYSTKSGYVVDWTVNMYEDAALASFVESQDPHAQRIAKNTIEFERWARTNNR